MLGNYSPEKENRSPSPSKKFFQKNLVQTSSIIKQLTNLLNSHKIPIPQHLNNQQDENGLQLTKVTSSSDKAMAKIKARLADRQFQVKRLEEDFAEYKLLSRIENDKVNKKLREEITTMKQKHDEEVKKWQAKYTQTVNKYELEKESFDRQTEEFYKTRSEKHIAEMRLRHEKEITQLEQQLSQIQRQRKQTVEHLRNQYDNRIIVIKETHQKEIQIKQSQHYEEVIKTEEKCQAKVLAIECEKNADARQADQAIKTTFQKEQKMLKQIGNLERDKNSLFEKLDNTQMRLKVMTKKYQDLGKEMQKIKNGHEGRLQQVMQELSYVKSQTEKIIDSQRLKVLKEHYEKSQYLEKKLKDIEATKQIMMNTFQQNQKILDKKFSRRESRQEDVEIIKEIQFKLSEKQRQADQLYNHIKYFKLQKENNDKIYTKIFSSHRQKKGSSFKHDRDIYSLMKQCQTADVRHDMRHILKIQHKDTKK